MTQTRTFHLGDILSVTTGRLVSPRHIDGVCDILGWMTGEVLWTHQLPRASEAAAPALLEQHPDLAAVTVPDFAGDKSAVEAWLAGQVATYGEYRKVAPLAAYTGRDPLTELAELVDPDRVVLEVPDE